MFISKTKIKTLADFCALRHSGLFFGDFETAYSHPDYNWLYPDFRDWWERNKTKIIGHYVVGFAFTDYGGDFFDFCCCQVVRRIVEGGGLAMHEGTSYNGENCIILGDRADRIADGCRGELYDIWRALVDGVEGWDYPELDDYMTMKEEERRERETGPDGSIDSDLLPLSDQERGAVLDWLRDNARVTATGLDYCYSDLENHIREIREGGDE